jgi:hypothetical protein
VDAYKEQRQKSVFLETYNPENISENIIFYFDNTFNLVAIGSNKEKDIDFSNSAITEKPEKDVQDHGIIFRLDNKTVEPIEQNQSLTQKMI